MQKLRICTWNLGRPALGSSGRRQQLLELLKDIDADVFILTETSDQIDLHETHPWMFGSCPLRPGTDGIAYRHGERRTVIWSRFAPCAVLPVSDAFTSVHVMLDLPCGAVQVYGTIAGITGGRDLRFYSDLENLAHDLSARRTDVTLFLAGDLNQSLGDNYYFTEKGRRALLSLLKKEALCVPTAILPENIDHIALSEHCAGMAQPACGPLRKRLSDHKPVWIDLLQ